MAPLQSNQAVCIQGEPKESMVNSCLDPRPGRNSFLESSGQNIGQNHSIGNAYNYLLIVGWLDDRDDRLLLPIFNIVKFLFFPILLKPPALERGKLRICPVILAA